MRIRLPTLIVLACAPLIAQNLPPPNQDPGLAYGADADFVSAYVWRGIVLDNRASLQPSVWVSWQGLEFAAWNSLALDSRPGASRLSASDFILTYTRLWSKLVLEPGLTAYLLPFTNKSSDRNTIEGSMKLSYPVGPVRVFTTNALDLVAYKSSYFGEAGAGYTKYLAKSVEFELQLSSGWASSKFNDAYVGVDKSAFNLVAVNGSITYKLKSMYFKPHIELSRIMDRELRQELPSPTTLTFGLMIGINR